MKSDSVKEKSALRAASTDRKERTKKLKPVGAKGEDPRVDPARGAPKILLTSILQVEHPPSVKEENAVRGEGMTPPTPSGREVRVAGLKIAATCSRYALALAAIRGLRCW